MDRERLEELRFYQAAMGLLKDEYPVSQLSDFPIPASLFPNSETGE